MGHTRDARTLGRHGLGQCGIEKMRGLKALIHGQARHEREALARTQLGQALEMRPRMPRIDVVGRDRRDAAKVVDAGRDEQRRGMRIEVGRRLHAHAVGQDEPRPDEGSPDAVSPQITFRSDGEKDRGGDVGVELQPGRWQVRTEVSVSGMPNSVADAAERPAAVTTMCLSKDEARTSSAGDFAGKMGPNCSSQGFDSASGRVNGTITCPGDSSRPSFRMAIDGSFQPDSYDVTSRVTLESTGGDDVRVETRTVGRRIGDCLAGEKG